MRAGIESRWLKTVRQTRPRLPSEMRSPAYRRDFPNRSRLIQMAPQAKGALTREEFSPDFHFRADRLDLSARVE